ncbi:hypothetical protein [Gulosibacter chungangensis]|nr:hypothetical protein [Gulosibacter chungangensis]
MAQYQPYPQHPGQPQYNYERPASQTDSLGSWMLAVFLMMIPIVGFIYLLVLAFGGTESIAKKNYARATLLWMVILVVISIVIGVVMAIMGVTFFSYLDQSSTSVNY